MKPLYQDPIKRKRRLDNLKLLKVQEILFDEFIYKLKEPKKPREVKKKETKKKEEKEEKEKKVGGAKKKEEKEEKEKKEEGEKIEQKGELDGEIRIINSKIKEGLCYSIKINKNKKVIYTEDNKDIIKSITKDKLLNELLIKLHKKFKSEDVEFKLNLKINYKDYVKKFNIMISKFNNYIKKAESYDPKTNDIEMVKLHKEFSINIEILEIKNNITLIE